MTVPASLPPNATVSRMIAVWGRAAGAVAAYKARTAAAEGNADAAARWDAVRAAVAPLGTTPA
ncbi:hypothetical protein [Arenibaculum pallidiluteum]|uniref:hypothetical protein n=1 Tax=Arenibaculum pallidiluteum TaxID=2812559 RepID=UPI001A9744D1|nr:hypothetical protein [Arenibaculum pallidiluteum]